MCCLKNAQKQNDYFVAKVKSLLTDAKGNTAQANAALTEEEKEGKRRIAALIPKFSGTLDEKVRLAANQYQSNTDIAKAEAEGKITETARRAEALLKKANKNIDQFDTHFKKDEKAINKEVAAVKSKSAAAAQARINAASKLVSSFGPVRLLREGFDGW